MKPIQDHDLIQAARALPGVQPSPERVAAVREQLLQEAARTPQAAPPLSIPRLSWPAAAVIIASVFAATAWWMTRPGDVPTPPRWASVVTSGTSTFDYLRSSEGGRQWVRLHDGRILLDVIALERPRRFIIEAAGAEIETQDSLLEVDVREAQLAAILVLSGRAQLRRPGHPALSLEPGQRWSQEPPEQEHAPRSTSAAVSPEPKEDSSSSTHRTTKRPVRPPAVRRSRATPKPVVESNAAETDPPAERAFRRGWAALREGHYAQAAEAFTDASMEGSPVREDATYWRAVALLRAGQATQAEAAFHAYLEAYAQGARSDEAALLLGRLLWARGDTKGAQPWLLKASRSKDATVRDRAQGLLQGAPGRP